jgi:hypothetical protein
MDLKIQVVVTQAQWLLMLKSSNMTPAELREWLPASITQLFIPTLSLL